MATAIGRGIGVCYQLFHLAKSKGPIKILRHYFAPDKVVIRGMVKIAWNSTMQFLVSSASWIVMARIIAQFHDTAIAGYQVAIRILVFFILPAWGMSNAAATLVGQNLGAGRPDRAEAAVRTAVFYNALFMLMVSLLFLLAAEPIVHFINRDPDVSAIATRGLRIISLGYIFYGVGMVLTNAFNGAGDTRTPMIISLFVFWAFQIPLGWFLAIHLGLGPKGVFLAILTAESSLTIVSFILFRRGKWKKIRV
jgi:putative MATE family efflux protein